MAKIRLRRGAFATMISAHPDPATVAIALLLAITVMRSRYPANWLVFSICENNFIDRADMATTAADEQAASRDGKSLELCLVTNIAYTGICRTE